MFQPLVKFYFNSMDVTGEGHINADEFAEWFPKLLEFREMWRRCDELRAEYPLQVEREGG